jgi:hypothetical protein
VQLSTSTSLSKVFETVNATKRFLYENRKPILIVLIALTALKFLNKTSFKGESGSHDHTKSVRGGDRVRPEEMSQEDLNAVSAALDEDELSVASERTQREVDVDPKVTQWREDRQRQDEAYQRGLEEDRRNAVLREKEKEDKRKLALQKKNEEHVAKEADRILELEKLQSPPEFLFQVVKRSELESKKQGLEKSENIFLSLRNGYCSKTFVFDDPFGRKGVILEYNKEENRVIVLFSSNLLSAYSFTKKGEEKFEEQISRAIQESKT